MIILDGSIITNLRAAVQSSQRLRDSHVYPETLSFWSELLEHAYSVEEPRDPRTHAEFQQLIQALSINLAQRRDSSPKH
jgi:hypothetical protein